LLFRPGNAPLGQSGDLEIYDLTDLGLRLLANDVDCHGHATYLCVLASLASKTTRLGYSAGEGIPPGLKGKTRPTCAGFNVEFLEQVEAFSDSSDEERRRFRRSSSNQ
jgi:hypothetical protein